MFHAAGLNGHARRTVACAFVPAFAAFLMQCATGPPLLKVTGYRTRKLALPRWALQFGCDGGRT